MGEIKEVPSFIPSQKAAFPMPLGATIPKPVTTTLLIIFFPVGYLSI
jgi:hypothetical protein